MIIIVRESMCTLTMNIAAQYEKGPGRQSNFAWVHQLIVTDLKNGRIISGSRVTANLLGNKKLFA